MIRKKVENYEILIDDDFCEAVVIGLDNFHTFRIDKYSDKHPDKIIVESNFNLCSTFVTNKYDLIDALVVVCKED